MDLKEFDALIHDAEVKLKRLKALYEQWFQGIERTEPSVPRKDLERLFVILNREKPRNTAARFRLQQLVARYQIYITYWGRIARQIEEGTYERDVRRARRVRGAAPPAKETKAYELDLEEEIDVEGDMFGDDEIASVLRELDTQPKPEPVKKPGLGAFSPFAMAGARIQTGKQAPPREPATKQAAPVAREPIEAPKKPVTATFGKPQKAAPIQQEVAKAAGAPTPRPPEAARPAASFPRPSAPEAARPAAAFPRPSAPEAARPAASFPRPGAAQPTAPRPSGSAALPPRPPSIPRPVAAAPPRPPSPPRPPAAREDDGLKRLYDSYVAARRRNNEQGDVAYDKLATSVRHMTSKLREKHGNKKIDFEVVVQNGKVGLKPKIDG